MMWPWLRKSAVFFLVFLFAGPLEGQLDRVELASLLKHKKFDAALYLLRSNGDADDPQIPYWQAYALLGQGHEDEAIPVYQAIVDRWPESEFANSAARLIAALESEDETADQMLPLCLRAVEYIRQHDWTLQFSLTMHKLETKVEFGIDFNHEHCQFRKLKSGETWLQYESTPEGSRWYLKQSDQIREFEDPVYPVFSCDIEKESDAFTTKFAGAVSSNPVKSADTLRELFNSPWLTTEAGLREFYVAGAPLVFPEQVESGDETTVCRWISPSIDSPLLNESTNEFCNTSGRLIRWSTADMELVFQENTNHLATNERWLEPLSWPDKQTIYREKLDVKFMRSFIGQIYGQEAAARFAGVAVPADTRQR